MIRNWHIGEAVAKGESAYGSKRNWGGFDQGEDGNRQGEGIEEFQNPRNRREGFPFVWSSHELYIL